MWGAPGLCTRATVIFDIYINDLPLCLLHTSPILFADDTTIFKSSDNIDILYQMINHDLCNLVDWFRANRLSLNTSKSYCMLFNDRTAVPTQRHITIENEIIERKNHGKFLGLVLDERLNWSHHLAYVRSKLSRSLYAMNRMKHILDTKHLTILYQSLIHSHLSYGLILWGSTFATYLKPLQVCQRKSLHCIYNAAYDAHSNPFFARSNILKLEDLWEFELCKFVFDALHGFLPKPLSSLYMFNATVHSYITRQSRNPHVVSIRTLIARNSPSHQGPMVWSRVPVDIRNLNNRNSFKHSLKRHFLRTY